MDQPLSVDSAELRATGEQLRQLAEDAERMVASLRAALSHEGECWGDDDPGKTFAKTYVPGADRGIEGLENLAANLHALQSNTAGAADNFDNHDLDGGNRIGNSGSTEPTAMDALVPQDARYPVTPSVATPDATRAQPVSPPAGTAAAATPYHGDPDPNAGRGADPNPQSPTGDGTRPTADRAGQPSNGADSPDGSYDPNSATSDSPVEATDPAAAAPTPANAPNGAAADGGRQHTTPPDAGATGRTAARADTPWSRGTTATPATPWAKPAATTPPATESETPPRVSPPRRKGPGTEQPDKKRDNKTDRPARRNKPVAGERRDVTDAEALRIAREMASRHDIEIAGFEEAGITVDAVLQMSEALDSVLGTYPAGLRGIEIRPAAGSSCQVENRGTAPESAVEPWIVVATAAAVDPASLAASDAAHRPAVYRERPMFAAIVRELGAVLDLTGGSLARKEAQRALITEYVRISGAERDTLAQIVDGYRRWREQLGPDCLRHDMFAPDLAVAHGFAEVELSGSSAGGPAKVLHRLLTARAGERADANQG
ncbi:WXG100 family type VII secretion target [Nocardia spumae]|uniref:WXG100 family type VII secretion target n=1 Tax=Nocardia spumae TaxID=2887190 RepID=UPI001D15A1CB|nr:hypothetical protein [Nocardia spumae]